MVVLSSAQTYVATQVRFELPVVTLRRTTQFPEAQREDFGCVVGLSNMTPARLDPLPLIVTDSGVELALAPSLASVDFGVVAIEAPLHPTPVPPEAAMLVCRKIR